MTNWYNETLKELKNDETIQKSYRIELDDHEGYLSLTDDRLIFIRVKGFLNKTYQKTMDLPYTEIKKIDYQNANTITLFVNDNKRYSFSTFRIPVFLVKKCIEYYRNQMEYLSGNQLVAPIWKDVHLEIGKGGEKRNEI